MLDPKFIERIADEVAVTPAQVTTVIRLFETGGTIPFVARYRKDATGNLDEVKLEAIGERHHYFSSLMQRRKAILENIERQGKLTDELRAAIEGCTDKNTLEDLYLPYKKKRRTKATVAREQGLEGLAHFLLAQVPGEKTIEEMAESFVDSEKGVENAEAALRGARHIMAEDIASDADGRSSIRDRMLNEAKVRSIATKNAEGKKTKFESYYDFSEDVKKIPSHRLLAILRGVKEGFLRMELAADDASMAAGLLERYLKEPGSVFEPHIRGAVMDAYERLMRPSIETEVVGIARQRSDEDAIRVFRDNAKNLLLTAPAGRIRVIGLDPGHKTGCKLAVIDDTGTYLESATIFPDERPEEAREALQRLIEQHEAYAVAIGNGTGCREASKFVSGVLHELKGKFAFAVIVNEAGASVYSASKLAREEFPDLDVTIRGAVSIARRLQDPLAELVKLEPRSIGVGQYQHDVNQKALREGLHRTVVSCVNLVGVDLNTASVPLLRYVSGIQYGTAQNIVAYRSKNGGFRNRQQLLEVDGIGPKVFEQCAGFMRIQGGDQALDGTAIHPEAYEVVETMASRLGVGVKELIGNEAAVSEIGLGEFATDSVGELALKDIAGELVRPGRDPRRTFQVPKYIEGVNEVKDLEVGMEVEGMVTNVTNFGAFIDIGVHQDGLVHLSELANRYVRDPREVVAVGEIVKVKVIGVDKELPRISLSIKALQPAPQRKPRRAKANGPARRNQGGGEAGQEASAGQSASQEGRPARTNNGKPQRKRDNRKKSKQPPVKVRTESGDSSSPLNTQLADQLAALKEKFGG